MKNYEENSINYIRYQKSIIIYQNLYKVFIYTENIKQIKYLCQKKIYTKEILLKK